MNSVPQNTPVALEGVSGLLRAACLYPCLSRPTKTEELAFLFPPEPMLRSH